MMRYDSCYPSTEEESHKLMRLISQEARPEDHILRLSRVARNDLPPTRGRWQSFGCTVLDARSPDDEPLSDEEILALVKEKL